MKKLILSLALLASFAAHAAGASTGLVGQVIVVTNSQLMIYQSSSTSTGQPGCATSASWYVVDTSTAAGLSQYRQLEKASVLGRTVTFAGSGACNSTITNVENLAGVTVQP